MFERARMVFLVASMLGASAWAGANRLNCKHLDATHCPGLAKRQCDKGPGRSIQEEVKHLEACQSWLDAVIAQGIEEQKTPSASTWAGAKRLDCKHLGSAGCLALAK